MQIFIIVILITISIIAFAGLIVWLVSMVTDYSLFKKESNVMITFNDFLKKYTERPNNWILMENYVEYHNYLTLSEPFVEYEICFTNIHEMRKYQRWYKQRLKNAHNSKTEEFKKL